VPTTTRMDARAEIEGLVAHRGRGAGSDAERRAAGHIAQRLEVLGREARVEPTRVRPWFAVAHAVSALISIAASMVAVAQPAIGAAIALAAAFSSYGDLTGRFHLLRLVTPKRASQNVVSEEGDATKPGLLVLLAHHDAALTGAVFKRRALERRARIGALLRRPFGPLEVLFYAQVLLLVCLMVRSLLPDSDLVSNLQFVPTVVLIVCVPLLLDVALSDAGPGANDNASGVATVLRLLERHGGRLANFDLWAVFAGAEEAQALGMRAWLRRHRRDLDRRRTIFVDLDKVGAGTVRYARREGLILPLGYDPQLLELCERIAREDREEEGGPAYDARTYVARTAGDAAAARLKRFRAVSVACLDELGLAAGYHGEDDLPEAIEDAALERAFWFCSELIERIDAEIGPELEARPEPAA
jgi:peptidase M28-like protein